MPAVGPRAGGNYVTIADSALYLHLTFDSDWTSSVDPAMAATPVGGATRSLTGGMFQSPGVRILGSSLSYLSLPAVPFDGEATVRIGCVRACVPEQP